MELNHATVQDEREKNIRVVVGDPSVLDSLLADAETDQSFHVLRQIDPYGDTVLNRLQVEDFLEDLRRLVTRVDQPSQRSALAELIDLATEALKEPHRFLKLHGD